MIASLLYSKEFARSGIKSYILIATSDMRNENYEYTIMKQKDGHLQRLIIVTFEVMTVMLNCIDKAIDVMDEKREWLSQMAIGPLVGKYYALFCITIYVNGGHQWGVSASLRVSDRRIYIGLHEMEALADTLPKAMYLHFDAQRRLTE